MTSRQGWATASAFSERIGFPPGAASDLTTEAAWRVIVLVQAHRELAESARTRTIVQAILSGPGSTEGFEATTRAYRRYTECVTPWLETERLGFESELRRKAHEFSKYVIEVQSMPDSWQGKGPWLPTRPS